MTSNEYTLNVFLYEIDLLKLLQLSISAGFLDYLSSLKELSFPVYSQFVQMFKKSIRIFLQSSNYFLP